MASGFDADTMNGFRLSTMIVSQATSMATGVIAGPTSRAMNILGNWNFPNAIPAVDEIFNAWVYGHITDGQMSIGYRAHGISMPGSRIPDQWKPYAEVNQFIIDGKLAKPEPLAVFSALLKGVFEDADDVWIRQHCKMDNTFLTHAQDMFRQQWSTVDVMLLANRQYLDDNDVLNAYRRSGGFLERDMKGYEELRRFIPPVSDLIRMTVKEAFNDQQINDLELGAELEEADDARQWAERQGIGFCRMWQAGQQVDSIDWFNRYWYAHWDHMSPGQLGQALARLRPERIARYQKQIPGVTPFTITNYNTLMKANDYPPPERRWLGALTLSLPRLVDTRNQYFYGIIDRQELIELQLDRQYTETDAERFAQLADKQKEVWKYKHRVDMFDSYDRRLFNAVLNAFRVGSLGEAEMFASVFGILKDVDAANSVATAEVLDKQTQIVKASVAAIRISFYTGEVPLAEVFGKLTMAGVDPAESQRLADLWELKMTMPRRVRTASQLTGDFVHGFISLPALSQRLQNLGYSERDTSLALAEALRRQQLFRESEQKKDDKKKGKGGGGTTDKGERWLTPERIAKWRNQEQMPPEMADALMVEIDVDPKLIPLFYGGKING